MTCAKKRITVYIFRKFHIFFFLKTTIWIENETSQLYAYEMVIFY